MRTIVPMLKLAAGFVLKKATIAAVKNDSALTHWLLPLTLERLGFGYGFRSFSL
jgi:hypothetical protein